MLRREYLDENVETRMTTIKFTIAVLTTEIKIRMKSKIKSNDQIESEIVLKRGLNRY